MATASDIGTVGKPHKLVAAFRKALATLLTADGFKPRDVTLAGANGSADKTAGPNAKGELLVKVTGQGTVAYVSLRANGTLHVERSSLGLKPGKNGTPDETAAIVAEKIRARMANESR